MSQTHGPSVPLCPSSLSQSRLCGWNPYQCNALISYLHYQPMHFSTGLLTQKYQRHCQLKSKQNQIQHQPQGLLPPHSKFELGFGRQFQFGSNQYGPNCPSSSHAPLQPVCPQQFQLLCPPYSIQNIDSCPASYQRYNCIVKIAALWLHSAHQNINSEHLSICNPLQVSSNKGLNRFLLLCPYTANLQQTLSRNFEVALKSAFERTKYSLHQFYKIPPIRIGQFASKSKGLILLSAHVKSIVLQFRLSVQFHKNQPRFPQYQSLLN